jgi:cysteine desulfurase
MNSALFFAGKASAMPVYLDCNATTPMEPAVIETMLRFMTTDYGNAASPIHPFGEWARLAIEHARMQIARQLAVRPDDLFFTSGATEANNLALLGLAPYGEKCGRKHILSSAGEHQSVLEPLMWLEKRGFEVELLPLTPGGFTDPKRLAESLRPDTFLVSLMQVNNETGIRQPLEEMATLLQDHPAFWHVDAVQGFGKEPEGCRLGRIDLISVSAHKIYGPKGVGALAVRRRGRDRPPLEPLMAGGGQEQGLRPGTLPVPLIVGFGEAAKLADRSAEKRREACLAFRSAAMAALQPLEPVVHGDPNRCLPHTVNLAFPGIAAEGAISALKDVIAVSATSACTSGSNETSHVLRAMGVPKELAACSFRISWCHMTEEVDWENVVKILQGLRMG